MAQCLYCGRTLPLFLRLGGESQFCSRKHRDAFRAENDRVAVDCLLRAAESAQRVVSEAERRNNAELSEGGFLAGAILGKGAAPRPAECSALPLDTAPRETQLPPAPRLSSGRLGGVLTLTLAPATIAVRPAEMASAYAAGEARLCLPQNGREVHEARLAPPPALPLRGPELAPYLLRCKASDPFWLALRTRAARSWRTCRGVLNIEAQWAFPGLRPISGLAGIAARPGVPVARRTASGSIRPRPPARLVSQMCGTLLAAPRLARVTQPSLDPLPGIPLHTAGPGQGLLARFTVGMPVRIGSIRGGLPVAGLVKPSAAPGPANLILKGNQTDFGWIPAAGTGVVGRMKTGPVHGFGAVPLLPVEPPAAAGRTGAGRVPEPPQLELLQELRVAGSAASLASGLARAGRLADATCLAPAGSTPQNLVWTNNATPAALANLLRVGGSAGRLEALPLLSGTPDRPAHARAEWIPELEQLQKIRVQPALREATRSSLPFALSFLALRRREVRQMPGRDTRPAARQLTSERIVPLEVPAAFLRMSRRASPYDEAMPMRAAAETAWPKADAAQAFGGPVAAEGLRRLEPGRPAMSRTNRCIALPRPLPPILNPVAPACGARIRFVLRGGATPAARIGPSFVRPLVPRQALGFRRPRKQAAGVFVPQIRLNPLRPKVFLEMGARQNAGSAGEANSGSGPYHAMTA